MTSVEVRPTGLGSLEDVSPPAPKDQSLWKSFLVNVVGPFIVFLLVIGFWYFITYALLTPRRRFLMPPPHDVLDVAFFNWDNLSRTLEGLLNSTKVAMVGLAIAIVLGMLFAIVMSQAKWLERSLFPYAVILQTIPILALVPLIGFWFEFNFRSRVIVCVLIALFPIINNTLFGLLSADQGQHDLFTLHRSTRFTRLWRLQLPGAMPAIFAGFRISAGLAVIGAIVGDFFFRQGEPGIGVLIDNYRARIESEKLFGAIILSSLLGVVVFWVFGIIGNRVVGAWHESGRKQPG